jgi:hypothetical protein
MCEVSSMLDSLGFNALSVCDGSYLSSLRLQILVTLRSMLTVVHLADCRPYHVLLQAMRKKTVTFRLSPRYNQNQGRGAEALQRFLWTMVMASKPSLSQ